MSTDMPAGSARQTADAVLTVRPAAFGSNPETLASNAFQTAAPSTPAVAAAAAREFDALTVQLAAQGVHVHAFGGQTRRRAPDEVFPNNWLSTHADGTVVLYPLMAPSRRIERRLDVVDALRGVHGYRIERVVDLTGLEERGVYLEGTGSLVLDRVERIAYACRSPRTHPEALIEFARATGYEVEAFDACDRSGRAIYHTNVLLSIGTGFAAICARTIADDAARRRVLARLERQHEIVDIDFDQLRSFAGNMLALRGGRREVIALSRSALASLDERRVQALERHGALVTADIATIEQHGGGSVRCMLAEVHLPRA